MYQGWRRVFGRWRGARSEHVPRKEKNPNLRSWHELEKDLLSGLVLRLRLPGVPRAESQAWTFGGRVKVGMPVEQPEAVAPGCLPVPVKERHVYGPRQRLAGRPLNRYRVWMIPVAGDGYFGHRAKQLRTTAEGDVRAGIKSAEEVGWRTVRWLRRYQPHQ